MCISQLSHEFNFTRNIAERLIDEAGTLKIKLKSFDE